MKNRDMPASPFTAEPNEDAQAQCGAPISPIYYTGLSKREAFVKAAMEGLLSNPNIIYAGGTLDFSDRVKKMALRYADNALDSLEETE